MKLVKATAALYKTATELQAKEGKYYPGYEIWINPAAICYFNRGEGAQNAAEVTRISFDYTALTVMHSLEEVKKWIEEA